MENGEFGCTKTEKARGARAGDPDWPAGAYLQAMTAAAFGLSPEALMNEGRGPADIAFARQVAMYLAHTRLNLSFISVGRLFGRDRTTARHACGRVEERREDPRIDSLVDHLERAIDVCPRFTGPGSDGRARTR